MVSDQENDSDVSNDEGMSEKETKPYPNPPTSIKARSNSPQSINHIILDTIEGVDTEHYYSDIDPDNEEEESEANSAMVTSPETVQAETKPTGLSGGDSHHGGGWTTFLHLVKKSTCRTRIMSLKI